LTLIYSKNKFKMIFKIGDIVLIERSNGDRCLLFVLFDFIFLWLLIIKDLTK
jgi:hypothetical protein